MIRSSHVQSAQPKFAFNAKMIHTKVKHVNKQLKTNLKAGHNQRVELSFAQSVNLR